MCVCVCVCHIQMVKRQVFHDHKVDVVGVALNQVPADKHASLLAQVRVCVCVCDTTAWHHTV